jgi:hypothetical protein
MIESGNNLYYDEDKDRHFGRVWGGFSMPDVKPGFIVIVGEETPGYRPANPAPIFWLMEHTSASATELLESAASLKSRYKVSQYVARLTTQHSYILSQFNSQSIEQRKRGLEISDPPFLDEKGLFHFHLNCLLDRLRVKSKSVFLGKETKLAARLTEITQAEVSKARDLDFPEVSALCYVVSALTVSQASTRPPPKVYMDFDPLKF